jgi:hypothetical protein
MAELTLIIIDLAAGHAKLIGTEPRALPGRSSNWRGLEWLVILLAFAGGPVLWITRVLFVIVKPAY